MQTETSSGEHRDPDEPARGQSARRRYLVDRRFQLRYTIIVVVVAAVVSLLFGALMFRAHADATELLNLPDPLRGNVSTHDGRLLWLTMSIALVMGVSLALVGIVVTHRIAGPIFVFTHYMNVLARGRYPLLRPLRKRDELKAFYETINEAIDAMKQRDLARAAELNAILESLREVRDRSPALAEVLGPAISRAQAMRSRFLETASSAEPATPGQVADAATTTAPPATAA